MFRSAVAASGLAARAAQRPVLQLVRATCEAPALERVAQLQAARERFRIHGARGFACASRFDLPPPKMVLVEYDEKNLDDFIALADAVEDEFVDLAVDGNPGGKEPRKGAFEITLEDGSVLFSRLKVGRLPKTDDVIRAIKRVHTTQETEKSDGAACII